MDTIKVNWMNSKDSVRMTFPIAKIDEEKRTVSGFATLDNVDRHGDIVLPDASEKAFSRFRGNIREMHQPIAAGKVVSFVPQQYFDPESNTAYNGIFVDAYISKGAEDTWQKVLDGTLTGFSIGGNIIDTAPNAGGGKIIKDYELMELSLVDNPANPLANIFSIQKSADGITMTGIASDVSIENVFWCSDDHVAITAEEDSKNCVMCGESMSTIGWVEKSDDRKYEIARKMITGMFTKDDSPTTSTQNSESITSQNTINLYPDQNPKVKKSIDAEEDAKSNLLSKGGNKEMAENTDVVEADAVDEVTEDAVEEVQENGEAVEKAATVSELPVDELDFTKMLDNLKNDLTTAITKNYDVATSAATEAQKIVGDFNAEVQKSFTGLDSKISELTDALAEVTKAFSIVSERVDQLEGATAIRKSADADTARADESKKITKSMWHGSFLPVQAL